MLNRTAKTEREGRARRATGIEKYNSNVDRRTSQNGPLVFSAFVAVVVFACVLGGGFALTGEFNVWWLLGALVVAWAATMCAHIAMQWEKVVIFRFGKFNRMAGPGLYLTIPFIEQTALKADQRIMVTGFGAEETLTSDLVPINVDAVLFWMVWDAKKACLEVENYYNSVSLAAQTALRDAIGRASVSEVAIRRNQLDQELQEVIEERTSVWGITVHVRGDSRHRHSRRICRRPCPPRPRPSARRTPAWCWPRWRRTSLRCWWTPPTCTTRTSWPCACAPCTCCTSR